MPTIKLGELLVRANVLQDSQLKAALTEQQRWGGKLGDILVRMSLVSEDLLVRALAKQLGIPAVNLSAMESPSAEVLAKVPRKVALDLKVVPVQLKEEGKTLVVAMADPQNVQHLDTLRSVSRCRVSPVVAGKAAIDRARARFYNENPQDELPSGSDLKFVDAQGRSVLKEVTHNGPAPLAIPPAPSSTETTASGVAPAPSTRSPGEQLRVAEDTQRKEVAALKAMVELLVEKGLFTREEYLAKVRK